MPENSVATSAQSVPIVPAKFLWVHRHEVTLESHLNVVTKSIDNRDRQMWSWVTM